MTCTLILKPFVNKLNCPSGVPLLALPPSRPGDAATVARAESELALRRTLAACIHLGAAQTRALAPGGA